MVKLLIGYISQSETSHPDKRSEEGTRNHCGSSMIWIVVKITICFSKKRIAFSRKEVEDKLHRNDEIPNPPTGGFGMT